MNRRDTGAGDAFNERVLRQKDRQRPLRCLRSSAPPLHVHHAPFASGKYMSVLVR
ncbi:MAG: hypothetical protein KME11_04120 [Timaviella obliquedivisa GSE-PSE-MK23-08B]|nr:hypothetical protein [Timaviella obliquedivisa GSE-PSE-MK23-08B]